MSDNILTVEGVEKAFGGLKILHGVSFEIKRGEKMALIGPNGAGKSTLLNTIGGQGMATGGKIIFNGTDITHMSPNKRLHLGLGRSFQVNNLFWQPTILQNVLLALYGAEKNHMRFWNILDNRKDCNAEAERLLKTIGLWEMKDESPTLLSYGDQRMLELLLAFAADPSLVLLDEPSAGLPTAEVAAFTQTLRELAGDTTLLFCAHDMDLVFNLADTIIVLYFGQIIAKGTPDEIANNYQVQDIYLGGANDTYDQPRGGDAMKAAEETKENKEEEGSGNAES